MTSEIKVNKVSDSCGSALVTKCGSTITLGASGKTVAIASGASTTGMGRTGTVDWCTTAKTSPLTGVTGKGYFINTNGGAVTVTLPSSPSAGDIIAIADYQNTFNVACKSVTIGRNSSKINGVCADATLSSAGQSVTLVYVDGTRGWKTVTDSTSNVSGAVSYNVQYLVVAAGGGGAVGEWGAGGGGAGGFRTVASKNFAVVQGTSYPMTVGAGGGGGTANPYSTNGDGDSGTNSVFSTITSAGGGGAGGGNVAHPSPVGTGKAGGSGGGGSGPGGSPASGANGGAGNTPPVSPPQGNNAGNSVPEGGGSGGGAGAVGGNASGSGSTATGGTGGAGTASCISGSSVTRAGGGGGTGATPGGSPGPGGSGGGGAGRNPANGTANPGTANTGGGGGGTNVSPATAPGVGGNGGSGVVIIRYVSSDSPSASGGTKTTSGSDSIHTFNSDGTFVA